MSQRFRRAELDGMTGGGLVLETNLDRVARAPLLRQFPPRARGKFMGLPAPPFGDVGSSAIQTEERIMKIAVLGADLGKNGPLA
jgi:hypothetical protein